MVLIVPVSVWQSVSLRKIQVYLFYWFKNQPIKTPGERRTAKGKQEKRSSLAVENRRSRASDIFLSSGTPVDGRCNGPLLMVNMSQRSMECHRSIMSI